MSIQLEVLVKHSEKAEVKFCFLYAVSPRTTALNNKQKQKLSTVSPQCWLLSYDLEVT
jgi:hypothetical protein